MAPGHVASNWRRPLHAFVGSEVGCIWSARIGIKFGLWLLFQSWPKRDDDTEDDIIVSRKSEGKGCHASYCGNTTSPTEISLTRHHSNQN